MAQQTYLANIVAWFAAVETAVNAHLASEGLAEMVDWFTAEPTEFRESDFPYAWFEIFEPEDVGNRFVVTDAVDFDAYVGLALVYGGPDPEELLETVAAHAPHVVAAIEDESDAWGYTLRTQRVTPGPRAGQEGNCRLVTCEFKISGVRDWADVM